MQHARHAHIVVIARRAGDVTLEIALLDRPAEGMAGLKFRLGGHAPSPFASLRAALSTASMMGR